MKKQIFLLLAFLLIGKISFSQLCVGVDATFAYPVGFFNSQVEYGYGPKFNFGYSLNNKLDVSFGYELLFFNTLQPNFKIKSESLSFKYKFNLEEYNLILE